MPLTETLTYNRQPTMTTYSRANNDTLCIFVDFGKVDKKDKKQEQLLQSQLLTALCCVCCLRKVRKKLSQNIKQNLYHTCFTRNKDRTRVLIDWDNRQNNLFWDTKLYNELNRNRKSKRLAQKNLTKRKNSSGHIPL